MLWFLKHRFSTSSRAARYYGEDAHSSAGQIMGAKSLSENLRQQHQVETGGRNSAVTPLVTVGAENSAVSEGGLPYQ